MREGRAEAVTTDDRLLLTDLERIANGIDDAMRIEEYDDFEFVNERIKVIASDLRQSVTALRRAKREMVDFRERLERRLNG